jgi:hypothetical protein
LPSPQPRLCVSSLGASELAGLGDRERDKSAEGGVKGGGDTIGPTPVLGCGAEWADAAITSLLNEGEGEGMREIVVDEGFMGARNDGGSVKPRYIECAAQHQLC